MIRLALTVVLVIPFAGDRAPLLPSHWSGIPPRLKDYSDQLTRDRVRGLTEAKLGEAAETAAQASREGYGYAASAIRYQVCQEFFHRNRMDLALPCAVEGRRLAQGHPSLVFIHSYTLALIYLRVGNLELAEQAGWEALRSAMRRRVGTIDARMAIGLVLARLSRREESRAQFRIAVDEAGTLPRAQAWLAANLLDVFGQRCAEWGDLTEAARHIERALEIRRKNGGDERISWVSIALLRIAQGNPSEGLRYLDRVADDPPVQFLLPHWMYYHRARALLLLGKTTQALEALRRSARLAMRLRPYLPAADTIQSSAEVTVDSIFSLHAEVASDLALKSASRDMVIESFQAAHANRAWSLLTRTTAGTGWLKRVPEEYFRLLPVYRRAELNADRNPDDAAAAAQASRLRAAIAELESSAGLGAAMNLDWTPEDSRKRLLDGEALLAFHLTPDRGVRWVVDRKGIQIAAVPGLNAIRPWVADVPASEDAAVKLHNAILSGLPGDIGHLVIVPDNILFEIPFAALRDDQGRRLIETRSVRFLPTPALLPRSRPSPATPGFLAIADPISNQADPRWPVDRNAPELEMPRLAGSIAEVDRCSRLFPSRSKVLSGAAVNERNFNEELRQAPEVVHFATHVYQPPRERSLPVLSLGLTPDGSLAALDAAAIAALTPAPRFVTMSACGSGRGPLAPGTGLLGLTRSWLLAGSEVVVASLWPVMDDSGLLFQEYYRHLFSGARPDAHAAARALREAQLTMIRKGGWSADPAYWAAYFVIGVL